MLPSDHDGPSSGQWAATNSGLLSGEPLPVRRIAHVRLRSQAGECRSLARRGGRDQPLRRVDDVCTGVMRRLCPPQTGTATPSRNAPSPLPQRGDQLTFAWQGLNGRAPGDAEDRAHAAASSGR